MRSFAFGVGSGPQIARLYHRLLGGILVIAWVSLAVQIKLLIGSRGLVPVLPNAGDLPFCLFRIIPPTDGILVGGAWLGAALGVAAILGLVPRVLAGVQIVLYFSFAAACGTFLGFQWDNLLLECCLLAMWLPRDRPARLVHLMFRLLLFKLYFESGVAKWQSPIKDWHDGSAMTYYYETAPIPAMLAWTAHHLPVWWHHLESRATLVVELGIPLLFFGPRPLRLFAFATLTGFQLINLATANYGFFVYLALALHVFLLDDRMSSPPAVVGPGRRVATGVFLAVYVALSVLEGVVAFADPEDKVAAASLPLRRIYAPYRVVNTYHLFGSITRERIEPEFQTSPDGEKWTSHHFHFKPGPTRRAPPFVAPHQPRVDFLLWFFGLGSERRPPAYVVGLLRRMCHDPAAVESLFLEPLPRDTKAVRILFFTYHFADAPGEWWTATPRNQTNDIPCERLKLTE